MRQDSNCIILCIITEILRNRRRNINLRIFGNKILDKWYKFIKALYESRILIFFRITNLSIQRFHVVKLFEKQKRFYFDSTHNLVGKAAHKRTA